MLLGINILLCILVAVNTDSLRNDDKTTQNPILEETTSESIVNSTNESQYTENPVGHNITDGQVVSQISLPFSDLPVVSVINSTVNKKTDGLFYEFKLSNMQSGNVNIEILHKGTEKEEIVVYGGIQTIGPDGKETSIIYIVDKDGFRLVARPQFSYIDPNALKSLIG